MCGASCCSRMTNQPDSSTFSANERLRPTGKAASANRKWLIGGAVVAALAASAVVNRANARRAEADHPPAGAFITVNGTRLHYLERGSGSPVVLLHGNGVTLQDFEVSGVLDLVAKNHRVLAFDRPGFGYSERPRATVWTPRAQAAIIAAALEELGVADAVIVGHSWGALVALALAIEHPGIASGLVLLSGYYYGSARIDALTMVPPALPGLGDILANTVSPLSGALTGPAIVKASFSPADVPEAFERFPMALALRPKQVRASAADGALMVPAAVDLSRDYADLDLPVVIMAGEGDRIVGIGGQAERLAAELPDAELRVVAGQGHMLHYAVPDQVATAIEDVATVTA